MAGIIVSELCSGSSAAKENLGFDDLTFLIAQKSRDLILRSCYVYI